MKASNALFCLGVCLLSLCSLFHTSNSQFFTKTTNSIPRLGKKSDTLLPHLVRRVAKQLHFIINMVNEYDRDSNGQLDAEEIMDIPFIQNAVKSEIEARELRGQYLAPIGKAESESESNGKQRLIYDERMIM